MDEATKERLKWKFYKLAVVLNIIIMSIAVGFIALFKAPEIYKYPLSALFFIVALILCVYFWRNYRATKSWLDKNG